MKLENNEVAKVVRELLLSIKQNQVMGLLADVQPLLIGEVTKVLEWGREVCSWLLPLVEQYRGALISSREEQGRRACCCQ